MDKWDREFCNDCEKCEPEKYNKMLCWLGNDECRIKFLKAKLKKYKPAWEKYQELLHETSTAWMEVEKLEAEINKIDKVIDDNIKYWRKKEKVLRKKYVFPSRCIKEVMSIRGIILSLQKEINKLKRGVMTKDELMFNIQWYSIWFILSPLVLWDKIIQTYYKIKLRRERRLAKKLEVNK